MPPRVDESKSRKRDFSEKKKPFSSNAVPERNNKRPTQTNNSNYSNQRRYILPNANPVLPTLQRASRLNSNSTAQTQRSGGAIRNERFSSVTLNRERDPYPIFAKEPGRQVPLLHRETNKDTSRGIDIDPLRLKISISNEDADIESITEKDKMIARLEDELVKHEEMLDEKDVIIANLESTVSSLKDQVSELESKLQSAWKEKNRPIIRSSYNDDDSERYNSGAEIKRDILRAYRLSENYPRSLDSDWIR